MKTGRPAGSRAPGSRAQSAPLVLALLLAGCAVGRDYHTPPLSGTEAPQGWHATLPHHGSRMALAHWWEQFHDPVLTQLVEHADATSPTIAQAVGRVREARASVSTSRAALLPQLKGSGSATRQGGFGGSQFAGGAGGLSAGALNPTLGLGTITTLAAQADASWEIDLFGGKRRSLEGADARLTASEADWHDARVSLAAEVANTYLQQRECEALVDIGAATLSSRQETLQLTERKFRAGFVAPADFAQAQATVGDAVNALEGQRAQCAQGIDKLVALTGLDHDALNGLLSKASAQIPAPPDAGVPDVPAQVLSQRPDVSSAERAVAGASADVGVAVASRLPSITLAGSIGINSYRLGGQSLTSKSWSFGPSVSLPIFDGGAGAARVETARARYDQALASYRSKVRQAVQEVEDALVRLDASERRVDAATMADAQYAKVLEASNARYRLGAGSLLQLEDVRRTALQASQSLAAVKLERAQAWVALYKAVGGGWRDDAPNPHPDHKTTAPTAQGRTHTGSAS
ncbi:Probable efflux pump outer membrane protein ttgC precursor [Ralstonia pickettii]|jgi:multidrug efflux system outer membrane protein|uniref:efflux transporter outer membrane subunit n=1 Tax=Ralstonia TaxID=48736 RepID=UPI00022BF5CC|nr:MULTISPECIES: efflux transporter outer membrane subunit [Ralstonia]EGY61879.1 NodT family efflux transporter, outer membrane factor (OMF) lipoprotein [Ralstonia sp. 5_2_56FAA]KFL21515.1 efflux transporter, outer membrane factor (OMF) lipo, NodT family protein [Ralstonia pickettii]MBU6524437.1 efflux transporter outer membrane subunit [Ralstonia sp. B265]NPT49864.1 efflux transporter outer membrane subunit [Ralstonia sp. 3N]QQK37009.1 putative efflux pump outer membrane protein TtgC [Ralston